MESKQSMIDRFVNKYKFSREVAEKLATEAKVNNRKIGDGAFSRDDFYAKNPWIDPDRQFLRR